jgi:hypothetical protein
MLKFFKKNNGILMLEIKKKIPGKYFGICAWKEFLFDANSATQRHNS